MIQNTIKELTFEADTKITAGRRTLVFLSIFVPTLQIDGVTIEDTENRTLAHL
jgi:hypothetical protein